MFKVLILLLIPLTAFSQQEIKEVKITGLKRTKENFIRHFITSQRGEVYDSLKVERDRQQIINLEIIGNVSIEKSMYEDGIILTFHCTELINTIPIFALGKTNETFWFRAGVQDANLGGKGNKVVAYYQYYDRHSGYLNYLATRIKNSPWGFSLNFIKWAIIEPLSYEQSVLSYDYNNLTSGFSVIHHLSFKENIECGVYGFQEEYSLREEVQDVIPIESVERKGGLFKCIFRSNHIDFTTFYLQGFSIQLNTEIIRRAQDASLFFISFNDFKYFKRAGQKGNLATRFRIGLSSNEENPFAPFILDSYLNIRGVGNRVDRGTGSVIANVEYRHTFFDKNLVATQAVAFVDFGTWRKPGGNFSDFTDPHNMSTFSGLGLRFIYKRAFDTMLRVDYGFNFNNSGGFVVGIGQYF